MGSKLDRAVRQSESTGADFLKIHKWESGDTDIRLVPPAKGDDEDDWFVPVGLHYNIEKYSIICPNVTEWAGDPCPICSLVDELRQNNQSDDANTYSVRKPFYARAIVRGQEEEGVQILRLPSTLFRSISTIVQDTEAYGDVLSPGPKGRDIRIHKTGTNLDTKYQANVLPTQRAIMPSKEAAMALLRELPPISSILQIPDTAELNSIVSAKFGTAAIGVVVEEDDDWEEPATEAAPKDDILVGDWEDPRFEEAATEGVEKEDDEWLDDEIGDDVSASAVVAAARGETDELDDKLLEALPGATKGKAKARKSRAKKKE